MKPALSVAMAQPAPACPDKNLWYWQAFPPGGESDLSPSLQYSTPLMVRISARWMWPQTTPW